MNIYRYCFRPQYLKKQNPLIPLAAIAAGSGLAQGLLGAYSQNKANKLNYQMFQEGNEFNERMLNKQQAFSYEMWRRENEYNRPDHQVSRMLQAGLNPAALNGNANVAGLSGSVPSAGSASAASPSTAIQPVTAWSDAIASASSQFLNSVAAYKQLTEAYGQEIENSNKDALLKAQVHQMKEAGNLSKEQADNVNWDSTLKKTQFNDLVATTHQQALEAQYKADIANVESEVKKTYGMKIGEQEFNLAFQNAVNAVKEGNLLEAQKELTKITGDKEKSDMIVNRMVGASQVKANNAAAAKSYAEASEAQKRAYRQDLENAVYATFGKAEAAQRFLNLMYSGEMLKKDANVAGMLNDMMANGKFVRSTLVVGELLKAMSPFVSSQAMSSAASVLLK